MTLEVERSNIRVIRWTDADGDGGYASSAQQWRSTIDEHTFIESNGSFLTRDETRQLGELLIRVADEGWGS